MLKASYEHMAYELAYRQYMSDTAVSEDCKAFWDGATIAARQLVNCMQEEGAEYPVAYMKYETKTYAVYRVCIGEYNAELTINK